MSSYEFDITLDFEKGSRNPSRIFHGMGEYIDTFSVLDFSLMSIFDVDLATHLELDDVQSGSVRAVIRRVLNAVDDKALRDGDWKKVVGRFLHQAKYSILKWCEEHDEVADIRLLEEQAEKINQLAERTNLHYFSTYKPFTPQALITSVQCLENAGKGLHDGDKVLYSGDGEIIEVSRAVSFTPEVLAAVFEDGMESHRQKAIVTIKKPDYLGSSQWELKLDGHTIRAHILDVDWVTSFKKRQFEIRPGDSLRVVLDIQYPKDDPNRVKELHYEVVEVLGIVHGTTEEQQDFVE